MYDDGSLNLITKRLKMSRCYFKQTCTYNTYDTNTITKFSFQKKKKEAKQNKIRWENVLKN